MQVLVRASERARAEEVLVEAQSAIAPSHAPLAIAQGYELLGKNDSAQSNYQLALQNAPGDLAIAKRAIEFQMRTGLTAEAEPLLRKVLADTGVSESDRQWATRNLALARASSGRDGSKEALELIEGNLAVDSPAPLDQRVKALILARQPLLESRRKAVKIFEKLLTQETDTSVEDRFLLAKLYLATGERSKGRAELRRVLAARANEPRYLSEILQLLLQAQETSEAELWLARLQAIAPDDLATADFQAQLLFAKKRHAEVLSFVRDATARPLSKTESLEAAVARKLWGARRIEDYALKLREQKLDREAAEFETASEQLYQQYVQQRPADVLLLAEHSARVNQIDRSL